MVLSVLLAAILDFCVIVDQVLEHEIPQNKNVILNTKVFVSAVHPDMMYNHDNWDFICYFGGHFVLQFWKRKTKKRTWHGADLESAYPNCVKTTAWQILLRNALQTLRMPLFEKWALTIIDCTWKKLAKVAELSYLFIWAPGLITNAICTWALVERTITHLKYNWFTVESYIYIAMSKVCMDQT